MASKTLVICAKITMKTNVNLSRIILPLLILIAAAGNVLLWYYGRGVSLQVTTIVFALVWLNFVVAVFTHRRQPNLLYILLGANYVIEFLLVVDLFWVIGRML